MIAQGVPVPDAYRRAGYSGGDDARWDLRRSAEVDLRVNWLLQDRIRADTAARQRGEKKIVDARLRLIREFERVAYSSIGDLVQWDRKPVHGKDGSVEGFRDELVVTPSARLGRGTMATIRSVTTKSGALKIDFHEKVNAMNSLAKILGMGVEPVAPNVTVNNLNVGDASAFDSARRLAFLLANLDAQPEPKTIDAQPTKPATKG